jgi:drug/metabolite transporter (DMT)-like permease
MHLRNRLVNWSLFVALSFIWGSSFILMKAGLNHLSAYQVAALRIFSAGVVLLPVAIKNLNQIPLNKAGMVLLSGVIGSFLPAFLFCIAETRIDSGLTGILNAFTPIFTLITGFLFFKTSIQWNQLAGVITGLVGLCLLFLAAGNISFNYLSYASLVLLATIMYGVNVNMVSRYLKAVGSLNIAAFAFSMLSIPSFLILLFSGFFSLPLTEHGHLLSLGASALLGVMGTAVATILFYMLVKRAGVIFTSMVTYGIPFVAVFWGVIYGEHITLIQLGCMGIILLGVYLTNK